MKNKLLILSLLILPLILLILVLILKNSIGEYYLFYNYDGPYPYLLASLNIAQYIKPGFLQHPGIFPQILIAFTIKLTYLFQGNEANMVLDTFNRPEFYLQRINLVFTFLNVIALFFLGYFTFKKTGNIFAAIFIQFTPFISKEAIYQLTIIIPEPIIMFLIIVLITISISFLNESVLTRKKTILYIILFGVTCGLALATKISVLPILIIPFLLIKKVINKIYFLLITLFTFSVLFIPISPDSTALWTYVFDNILHSGKYGAGPANVIDVDQVGPKIGEIFKKFMFFFVIYLLILATLILQFIPKFKNTIRSNKYFLLIIGIFIIMSSFIVLVIKQKELYYLLPGFMFSITGLFTVNSVVSEILPKYYLKKKYLYIFIILFVFSIPNYRSYKYSIGWFTNRKNESHKIINFLNENYPNSILVSSDMASGKPDAFYNGLNFAGEEIENYNSILSKKYPNFVYFGKWSKKFGFLDNNKELENNLKNSKTIVFHSVDAENLVDFKEKIIELTKKPNSTFEEVFANKNGEKIYLVTLK